MRLKQKATHAELACYLGVAVSTVKKYPKKKLELMLIGLREKNKLTPIVGVKKE